MQLDGNVAAQVVRDDIAGSTSLKRRSVKTKKVTVRLSEAVHAKLQTATERPGVGKSMMVEDALDRFLNQVTPENELVGERFDEIHTRFDHLERDIRMMAETVALHARYHLALMPVLSESRQQQAVLLGDERFKVLAGQVDRRVRLGQPLLQETIDRLKSEGRGENTSPAVTEKAPHDLEQGRSDQTRSPVDFQHESFHSRNDGEARVGSFEALPVGCRVNGQQSPSQQERAPQDEVNQSANPQGMPLSKWRLTFSIFLPFAAGYFLSFFFRTINGAISPTLVSEFGLNAADAGLLASVYFLVFACAQIPIGILLDRYGPRRVHSVLLVLAVGGATLFGSADGFIELLVGRAMIGLGVSAALMAGLKAIVIWFPKERLAFVNGCMIMLGSLGAVCATLPADWLIASVGWRSLFELLTLATVVTAAFIYWLAPKDDASPQVAGISDEMPTLRAILSDPRFLRMAPLSATCIGSSWAMQALWAASWLSDVEGLDRPSLIHQVFAMAVAVSIGALFLGTVADRLRKRGVTAEVLLAAVGGLCVLAEFVLILRLPVPSMVPWIIVSIMGAATVLSFAIVADYFPKSVAARANGALNLLHFGWAFIVQYGIGLVVAQWPTENGHYPVAAYQSAFGISLAIQILALAWFTGAWLYWRRSSDRDQSETDEIRSSAVKQPHRCVAGTYATDGPW